MVVIRGRLTPEVGAVVQRALEAAADRLFRDTSGASTGDAMAEGLTPAQRRADALALLAESALAANVDGGTAGDRYQVVLHVNADDAAAARTESSTPDASPAAMDGAIEVDHGALFVSMEHLSDSRVTPRWCGCTTTLTAPCSTSAARRARFRPRFDALWLRATPVVASRAAHLTGATPTTCTTGLTDALRASTTWDGTRFDLPWAIDVIRVNPEVLANGMQQSHGAEGAAGAGRWECPRAV